MTQKDWEYTSSKNVDEWRAKAVQSDRHILYGIWGTETFKDQFGIERTQHFCLPTPSKELLKDIKKLEEKYKKKQKYFLDKSIKLLNKELKGI